MKLWCIICGHETNIAAEGLKSINGGYAYPYFRCIICKGKILRTTAKPDFSESEGG